MNNLILFTKNFPYGKEEAFIANELETMSQNFDSIMIVACEVSTEIQHEIRKVPPNVIVIKISRNFSKLEKLDLLLFNKIKEKIDDSKANTIPKKLFLKYFTQKSYDIFKDIQGNNEIKRFIQTSSTLIYYSYWFFVTAFVMINTKKMYQISNQYLLISRAHRYDLYENENKLNYLPMREYLLQEIDYIYPVSKNGKKLLQDNFPKFSNKIETSYLGTIDYGINKMEESDEFIIVTVSRIEPVKRIDKIVESLSLLEKNKNIKWIHFGSGSQKTKIKDLANKKLKNIQYELKGAVSNSEIIEFYKKNTVSLFLNASSSEGIPVAIMEASSFGIPVIATDVGGTSEIITDDFYLLNKNFNSADLSEKIAFMIDFKKNNISEYLFLKSNIRKNWQNNFDSSKNYFDFYSKIKKDLGVK